MFWEDEELPVSEADGEDGGLLRRSKVAPGLWTGDDIVPPFSVHSKCITSQFSSVSITSAAAAAKL